MIGGLIPSARTTGQAHPVMLVPFPGNQLTLFEASPIVNNPRNESAECIAPLETQPQFDLPEDSSSNCKRPHSGGE